MKIQFVYPRPRGIYLQNAPTSVLYGLKELQEYKYTLQFSDLAYTKWNILFWPFYPLQKVAIHYVGIGFKLDQAILLLPKIWQSDVVISTSDSSGLPILLLKYLKLVRTPQIYISIGLMGKLKTLGENVFFQCYKTLFNSVNFVICFSKVEREYFINKFHIPPNNISLLPFCVDTEYFSPLKKPSKKYILVAGRDLGRDYQLLIQVATKLKEFKFLLVCSPRNVAGLTIPDNVEVQYDVNFNELRKYYQESMMVVLPLKESQRASGQIVMLEAMSCAKPVIVSAVTGITDVYPLKSGENCMLVPPGNFAELSGAIIKLSKKPQSLIKIGQRARKLVVEKYSQQIFGQNLDKIIRSIT